MAAPVGNTPEFTMDLFLFLGMIQQLIYLLVPVAVLVIVIKINKKLDSLIDLMQVRSNQDVDLKH